jgi:hypothetical protein
LNFWKNLLIFAGSPFLVFLNQKIFLIQKKKVAFLKFKAKFIAYEVWEQSENTEWG